MKRNNIELGRLGEAKVCAVLSARGHRIIDRNWRIKEGEIDIVTIDQHGIFHFVEVKTRRTLGYGHPLEAITREKAHRLQKLALAWLAMHSNLARDFAIDCAAVLQSAQGELQVEIREAVL